MFTVRVLDGPAHWTTKGCSSFSTALTNKALDMLNFTFRC